MSTAPDFTALAEAAYDAHRAANEALYAAQEASGRAALAQLVYTAAAEKVARVLLEPSDQGPHMSLTDAYDADGESVLHLLDSGVEDDLVDAASDLYDRDRAVWGDHAPGVHVEENTRSCDIRTVTIDVPAAAAALLAATA